MGICGIMIYQTNRDNKKPTEEVTSRSGKGGTPIEAGSDFMIGLWYNQGVTGRIIKHRRIDDKYDGVPWPYFKCTIPNPKTYQITNMYEIAKPNSENSEF